jgi:PAS domain S-box-containing protein
MQGFSTDEADGRVDDDGLTAVASLAFELAPSMMGVVEPTDDEDILHVVDNRAASAFFGVEPGGTRNRLASAMGVTTSTIREWLRHYRESAATGKTTRFEYAYADGEGPRWMEVSVTPLEASPSGRQRFLYVAEDITPRKRAEEAKREAEHALRRERDFSSAMLDVAGAVIIVIDRDGRVTEFNRQCEIVSGRTRADVIGCAFWESGLIPPEEVAGARATWDELLAGHFPTFHENDWVATDGSRRTISWSNTALRDDDGRVQFVIATGIDITERKRAAVERLRLIEQLAQVFSNLLNNAAKYTPDGGVIELIVDEDDGARRATVTVRDNGIGIAPDVLPRVFEMFSQAAPALERARGGLGIGLSLVRGLVHLHGGSVAARSDGTHRGSEFIVTLPVIQGTRPSEKTEQPHAGTGRQRVLVVDDNADSADTLAALLEILGSEVRTAYDGEEALAVAETFLPDVVLLDVGMPRMSGTEACRRLRARPGGGEMLIVAMTGWGQLDDRRQTEAAGFDVHLVKPLDVAELTRLLAARAARVAPGA